MAGALIALVVLTQSAASTQPPTPPWSERGVFVFGSLTIDFPRRLSRDPLLVTQIVNCSNEQHYCASGTIVSLVLPRRCEGLDKAREWSLAGVRTTVLGVREAGEWFFPHSPPPEPVMLLGDRSIPYRVYEYTRGSGVVGIFYDPLRGKDFIAAAERGELAADAMTPVERLRYYNAPRTFDFLGRCQNVQAPNASRR